MATINRDQVFSRLERILKDLLKTFQAGNNVQITWDTDIVDDLGIDSVETLDLLNAIEEEFNVNPNISEVNVKRKISDIIDYIIELKASSE